MTNWHASYATDKSVSQSRSHSFSGGAVGDVRSAAARAAFLSIPEENAVDDAESSPPPTKPMPIRRRSTATRPFERSFALGTSGRSAVAYNNNRVPDDDRAKPNSDVPGLNAGATAFRPQTSVAAPQDALGPAHMRRQSDASMWIAEEEVPTRYNEPGLNPPRSFDMSSFSQLPVFREHGRWVSPDDQRRNDAACAQYFPRKAPKPLREFSSSSDGSDYWQTRQGLFSQSPEYLRTHVESSKIAVILFKMHRADLFFLPSKGPSAWTMCLGKLVVVEADRGIDLGTIVRICDTMEEAMQWKLAYMKEHYELLLNLCQSPRPHDWDEELAFCQFFEFNPSHSPLTRGARENNLRSVKREATEQEIESYMRKSSYEDKAKKLCCQLIRKHGLNVEIVDSEFQLDMHKLTFYFWSPHYLHFSALVTGMN